MKIPFYCFVSLLLLLSSSSNSISSQKVLTTTPSLTDLTLTISTGKQTFLPLEPIPLALSVKNNTAQPITAYIDLTFSGRHMKIFAQGPNTEETEIAQLSGLAGGSAGSGTRSFMPGDERKATELLAFNIERYFSVPGNYRIVAELCDNDSNCTRSQPLSFMMTEPQGQDLQAYNFIKASPQAGSFLIGGGDVPRLQQFVARFQTTAYNDYVWEMIGDRDFLFKRYQAAILSYEKITPQYAFAERIRQRITDARNAIIESQLDATEKVQ